MKETCTRPPESQQPWGTIGPSDITFSGLYERHAPAVLRTVRRLGVPRSMVEDATQDIFVILHRKLPDLPADTLLKAWIHGVTVHVVRGYHRSLRRKPTLDSRQMEALSDREIADEHGAGPMASLETSRSVLLLYRLLDTLDVSSREIFVMAELEELSGPEIAHILDVNLNTVYWRLATARKQFEQAFERERRADKRRHR